MTGSNDRHGAEPAVVRLPDLIAQVHERAAQTMDHDVEAGAARLTAWMRSQPHRTPAGAAQADERPPVDAADRFTAPPKKVGRGHTTPPGRSRKRALVSTSASRAPAHASRASASTRSLRTHWTYKGSVATRIAATCGQTVVAFVAVVHDPRNAIAAIASLGVIFLVTVLMTTLVATRSEDEDRRHDALSVLRVLLAREDPGRENATGDTFITINGSVDRISSRR